MIVPENEQGIVYLFSRYHKLLGFEEVLNVQTKFPDFTALRDGKIVGVEIEYYSGAVNSHHQVMNEQVWYRKEEWVYSEKHKTWDLWYKSSKRHVIGKHIHDPNREMTTDNRGRLVYKKISNVISYVVCWIEQGELLDKDVQVICLKDILSKLGIKDVGKNV